MSQFKKISLMLLSFSTPLFSIDKKNIEELAQKTYSAFVTVCKNQNENTVQQFADLAQDETCVELRNALSASFINNSAVDNRENTESVIQFSESLKKSFDDAAQFAKDLNITDKNVFELQLMCDYAHVECLKGLGLHHVFLHMLNNATASQQAVIALAETIKNAYWDYVYKTTEQKKSADLTANLALYRHSPLIKTMHQELEEAKTMDAVQAAANVETIRFFVRVLELKLTNCVEVAQRYAVTSLDEMQRIEEIAQNITIDTVLRDLGFEL